MKKKNLLIVSLFAILTTVSCNRTDTSSLIDDESTVNTIDDSSDSSTTPVVDTMKTITKDDYHNKTLAALLGQVAGFLSGYEFAYDGYGPYIGLPESWFDFLNGPYAGNYTYYFPGDYGTGDNIYDRHKYNEETKMYEVASDDDYHIDIFNQYIIEEYGYSSYGIKEARKEYQVNDWGGGADAIRLIQSDDMLAPFTGTIESGNRRGWCTEAYIENETLGCNAPGMPDLAVDITDKIATNVGYFDTVTWAKFYAAMYSIAYFETDIRVVMEKALPVLPKDSWPYQMYFLAHEAYEMYPNDYKSAAQHLEVQRRQLYRIDNIQTDPAVNGGFGILSWLYSDNDYMKACKYSSLMGYDGDCTAATVTGVMGILKGFKEGNEEYEKINDLIYYDGEGVYFNDRLSGFPPHIKNPKYPDREKWDDIIDRYQRNFEKILVENGGEILDDSYKIPVKDLRNDESILFDNWDFEDRTDKGFEHDSSKVNFTINLDTQSENSHSGYASGKMVNVSNGEVYHEFKNLEVGKEYRVSTYVKTNSTGVGEVYATDSTGDTTSIGFAKVSGMINKNFVFTATSSKMKVGIKFGKDAKAGDEIYFDDFMIEKINSTVIETLSTSELKSYTNKYLKTFDKPEGVNDEVILRLQYSSALGNSKVVSIKRNGNLYGSVVLSNTGLNNANGYDYVEIPYVFESDDDIVELSFNANKIFIGTVEVRDTYSYMFR